MENAFPGCTGELVNNGPPVLLRYGDGLMNLIPTTGGYHSGVNIFWARIVDGKMYASTLRLSFRTAIESRGKSVIAQVIEARQALVDYLSGVEPTPKPYLGWGQVFDCLPMPMPGCHPTPEKLIATEKDDFPMDKLENKNAAFDERMRRRREADEKQQAEADAKRAKTASIYGQK